MPRSSFEGKLFDRGEKGTLQAFQVKVKDNSKKGQVRRQIAAALTREGVWAG